ncbi:MAG: O-methyltransferase [Firmicutes bacterium]|nr:O-methyltransferase [Bacillota bacterium]
MNENIYNQIKEIKKYALDNKVPIMVDDGIDFLTEFIVNKQINSVLEIGSAIGYSAIMMALSNPNLKITTVERDRERYLEAVKNVKKLNLENQITLIFKDAFDVYLTEKYDLVFLDAAKGQNIKFFEKFEKNLNKEGYIITDNMDFHGLVEQQDTKDLSRNVRGLIRKINEYTDFLKSHPLYQVEFYKIGDGIAVATKK